MSTTSSPTAILQLINQIKHRKGADALELRPPAPINLQQPERLYSQAPGVGNAPYMTGDAPQDPQITPAVARTPQSVQVPPQASQSDSWGDPDGAIASDEFGNPIYAQDIQGSQAAPLRQRGNPIPMRGKYIHGDYNYPAVPGSPDLPDIHLRNNRRESRERGRAAGVAGILGLLLGGAHGAAAAAQGTLGGYESEADRQNALLQQQDAQQGNRAMQEHQAARQNYADQMGQIAAQQRMENQYNQEVDKSYASDMTNWNKAEDRGSKQDIAGVRAELSRLGLDLNNTKANNNLLLGLIAGDTRNRNAATGEKNASTLAAGVPIRQQQVDQQGVIGMTNANTNTTNANTNMSRVEMQKEHNAFMEWHYKTMDGINGWKAQMQQAKQAGQFSKPLTDQQRIAAIKDLGAMATRIAGIRIAQSQGPQSDDPADVANFKDLKVALEQQAQALRSAADLQAQRVGWVTDGAGGYKAPETSKANAKPGGYDAAMRGGYSSEGLKGAPNRDGIVPLTKTDPAVKKIQASVGSPTTGTTPVPQATPAVVLPKKLTELTDDEFRTRFAEKMLKGRK